MSDELKSAAKERFVGSSSLFVQLYALYWFERHSGKLPVMSFQAKGLFFKFAIF